MQFSTYLKGEMSGTMRLSEPHRTRNLLLGIFRTSAAFFFIADDLASLVLLAKFRYPFFMAQVESVLDLIQALATSREACFIRLLDRTGRFAIFALVSKCNFNQCFDDLLMSFGEAPFAHPFKGFELRTTSA
jgi:hypothetical protein